MRPSRSHGTGRKSGIPTQCPGACFALILLFISATARAHPLVENALDVVISADRVVIDARISMEEVLVAGAGPGRVPSREQWPALIQAHGTYALKHLLLRADAAIVEGKLMPVDAGTITSTTSMAAYRFEYSLPSPPGVIHLDQSLLREFDSWTVSCIVRIRQSDQPAFDTALLPREKTVEYGCTWSADASTRRSEPANTPRTTNVQLGPTFREYAWLGIRHILTGYDHLLFVSGLVLAATRLWDLVKVVTAFTLAHTLTLTLSVVRHAGLGPLAPLVEPMISASIVFVAVQNVFWPERSRGWTRLAIAFGFGLFHGLGFAGGLQEAMREMPTLGLWAALAAFSLGVEIGHQVVVLPLFAALQAVRGLDTEPSRAALVGRIVKIGSSVIAVAGIYFLVHAVRGIQL